MDALGQIRILCIVLRLSEGEFSSSKRGLTTGQQHLRHPATFARSQVDLIAKDDASGRQRWKISRISGDWHHITVVSGVSSKRRFLSTTESF